MWWIYSREIINLRLIYMHGIILYSILLHWSRFRQIKRWIVIKILAYWSTCLLLHSWEANVTTLHHDWSSQLSDYAAWIDSSIQWHTCEWVIQIIQSELHVQQQVACFHGPCGKCPFCDKKNWPKFGKWWLYRAMGMLEDNSTFDGTVYCTFLSRWCFVLLFAWKKCLQLANFLWA